MSVHRALQDNNDNKSDEEEPAADTSIIPVEAFDVLDISLQWLECKTYTDHLLLIKK